MIALIAVVIAAVVAAVTAVVVASRLGGAKTMNAKGS